MQTVELERLISAPRLQRYRDASQSETDTVVLYCWNIQLAEALLPSLALFEITLRNAVHRTLTEFAGTDYWFKVILNPKSYENVADLMATLTRRHGRPPSADKVISEITFGFWPKLFAHSYQSLWWDPNSPLLPTVLPHLRRTGRDTRKMLAIRLEYFAMLRNRAMHQEAIFQGVAPLNRPVMPIDRLHAQLTETIGWFSLDAARLVSCMDRFDDVYVHGRATLESRLRQQFSN